MVLYTPPTILYAASIKKEVRGEEDITQVEEREWVKPKSLLVLYPTVQYVRERKMVT